MRRDRKCSMTPMTPLTQVDPGSVSMLSRRACEKAASKEQQAVSLQCKFGNYANKMAFLREHGVKIAASVVNSGEYGWPQGAHPCSGGERTHPGQRIMRRPPGTIDGPDGVGHRGRHRSKK